MFEKFQPGNILGNPVIHNSYEDVLIEIWRAIKFHNPVSLHSITGEDLKDLAKNIERDYSLAIVTEAKNEVFKCHIGKTLTIGVFLEKCSALDKLQKTLKSTERLMEPVKNVNASGAIQNLVEIRKILQSSVKPLPYDKNRRVYDGNDTPKPAGNEVPLFNGGPISNSRQTTLTRLEDISLKSDVWDKVCFSDGPKLYEKCVAIGHIAPIESIQDPALRALYEKAWTIGLTLQEKEMFNNLNK